MIRAPRLTDDGLIEAIVGWRGWELVPEDGIVTLYSIVRRTVPWPQYGPMESECLCYPPDTTRRSFGCTCGIYAWNKQVKPWSPVILGLAPIRKPALVLGEVHLWGIVSVHERGYRGQYARPAALYVSDNMHDRLRRLIELAAIQYDVPLVKTEGVKGG